ncbi:MAG: helicase-related protein, partial [Pseudomonadota bacterium]
AFLVSQDHGAPDADTGELPDPATRLSDLVVVKGGAQPDIQILESEERLPWAGHSARYAFPEVYEAIKAHKLVLLFVNTRSQAEMLFHELWQLNEDTLPIALHHGSLEVGQRRKVEAAMADGRLRAVVCTSTLDLGIDWGDVDLVIHVGAPKGSSRLAQRIGRANHRMDEPSKALLVPANRFEVLECRAALEATRAGFQDTPMHRTGGLDVLAQHLTGLACAGPLNTDAVYGEVTTALPYTELRRDQFDRALDFVATGGYALRAYDRFARLVQGVDDQWRIANKRHAQQYRMNIGTIVDNPMLKVRLGRPKGAKDGKAGTRALVGGKVLGEIDEWYTNQLVPGDTFVFAGQVLRFEGMRDTDVFVSRATDSDPKVPSYQGGKFPMTTSLADRVRQMIADPASWDRLPGQVGDWLTMQEQKSMMPGPNELLVETFPRGNRHYFLCYPFEGRLAHQTLGVLLTRRLERARARPLGFVANDYAVAVWCLNDLNAMSALGRLDLEMVFDVDMLGDDLDEWLAQSSIMKRTFHMCAVVAGLIAKRQPGEEKTGRQMIMSTDLVFDVLRQHQPDHLLLEAAWADAATGLLDLGRLSDFLMRVQGRVRHQPLDAISPMAVPVMLEAGREAVYGEARDAILADAASELIAEAMGTADAGSGLAGAADRFMNPEPREPGAVPYPDDGESPFDAATPRKPPRRRTRSDGKPTGAGPAGGTRPRAGAARGGRR